MAHFKPVAEIRVHEATVETVVEAIDCPQATAETGRVAAKRVQPSARDAVYASAHPAGQGQAQVAPINLTAPPQQAAWHFAGARRKMIY